MAEFPAPTERVLLTYPAVAILSMSTSATYAASSTAPDSQTNQMPLQSHQVSGPEMAPWHQDFLDLTHLTNRWV
jgi:hypothetical protein